MNDDNRSAVWGGGTMGLFIGLIVGIFRRPFWNTVIYAVVIGAALGVGAEILARVANRPGRRN